jgi:hypothetical protein
MGRVKRAAIAVAAAFALMFTVGAPVATAASTADGIGDFCC